MKAVLDTNVWLDWLLFDDPSVAGIRQAAEGARLRVLAWPRARDELADVLSRPAVLAQATRSRARRGFAPPDPAHALVEFDRVAIPCEAPPPCGLACRDTDDQGFIDLAVAQHADWLFTKDRALLDLARTAQRRFGLRIVRPAGFVADPDL